MGLSRRDPTVRWYEHISKGNRVFYSPECNELKWTMMDWGEKVQRTQGYTFEVIDTVLRTGSNNRDIATLKEREEFHINQQKDECVNVEGVKRWK